MGLFQDIAAKNQAGTTSVPQAPSPTSGGGMFARLAEEQKPKPGIIKSFAQGVTKPFERIGQGVLNIAAPVFGLDKQASHKGIFGNEVDTIGYEGGQKLQGKELAKDVVGTGLEAASYAIPGGAEVKGLSTLAKVGKAAKLGGVAGATFGAGESMQNQDSLGETAVKSLEYGAGGALFGAALPPLAKVPGAIKDAVTTPSEKRLEEMLLQKFSKGVRPTVLNRTTPSGFEKYNDGVVNAVKTIRENEPNLTFTSADGETIAGRTPTSIKELMEAGDQTKRSIFNQYDALAKEAGHNGLNVELQPIAKELESVINNKALQLSNPKAIDYAMLTRDRFIKAGKVDAGTAQDVIQNYNKALEAFYRNPSYDNASQVSIDAMIANLLRKNLDEGIEGLTGKAYQELKNKYGALKSIEKDVIKAYLRDERKNVKGLIDFTDIFSGGQVVNGILSMNPATVASGLTQKAIAAFYKKLNDPNRAIQKMFDLAAKLPPTEGKQVAQRLALPPPTGGFRSQSVGGAPIPLPPTSQSRLDEQMIEKFGRKPEKVNQLQLPAGNPQNPPTGLPTIPLNPPRGDVSVGFPQRNQTSQITKPTANTIPSVGEIPKSIKNNSNGIIPPTLARKTKTASGQVLREGQEPIGKANTDDLVARERFDIPNLKKVSFGGSDRDVYDLGDNMVLKVIKSARGIEQNRYSSDYYAEGEGLIPKTIETGKNYIVKEKVNPPDAATKAMIKDLQELPYSQRDNDYYEVIAKLDEKYGNEGNGMYPFNELLNYGDILVGDLKAARNWGTTIEGKPVLLDEGTLNGSLITNHKTGGRNLDDPEFRDIYNQSRAAKKKFGDSDSKTMYGGLPFLGLFGKKDKVDTQDKLPDPKTHPLLKDGAYHYPRENTRVVERELPELGAILFGEVGNRPLDKKLLEARTIANIALNRMEKTGKTLTEVLQEDKQFQAYKGKQYQMYKNGTATDPLSKEKIKAIEQILDELRQGTLKNNIGDSQSYSHRKDNTLRVYKDWAEQKKDLANIK